MKKKINDVCKIISEKINSDLLDNNSYISTENMLPNFQGICSATSLPKGNVTSFKINDILLSNIRPYFKKIWFSKFDGGCSNDVIVLRANNNIILNKYLYYSLTNDGFINYYVASCKGTKMPRGNKDALLDWQINVPSINDQQHIVNTIGTIDDLIENKQQIIDRLKDISTLIYKQYKEKDFNSQLSLDECCIIKTGKLNADQADENGKYLFFTCGKDDLYINEYAFDCKAIIISGNGEIAVKYYEGKFNAYQRTYVLEPSKYFYLFLKECELNIEDLKMNSQGSVIKFITKVMLEKINIPINKEANKLNKEIQSIYNYISNLNKEINKLKQNKSTLLTKYF